MFYNVFIIFVQDLQNHEDKVAEVNNLAEQLVADGHPEEETIRQKQQVILYLCNVLGTCELLSI